MGTQATFAPPKPISITLEKNDLEAIGKLLSLNVRTKQDLMIAIQIASTFSVDGIDVRLEPYLLRRLQSRNVGARRFSDFLKETVVTCLRGYAGC